jgi:ABC-type multidrug transport system permease subunit
VLQSAPASSISISPRETLRLALRTVVASATSRTREVVSVAGSGGYIFLLVSQPIFQLLIAALIYRHVRPDLLSYSVVGVAASTFMSNTLYYIGQTLDEERLNGTLVNLFLAPCPRVGWLLGYAIGGLIPTVVGSLAAIVAAVTVFGVRFDPDYPALALSFVLFLASLWGMGFVFSAIGLILKRSNDLANLISPFMTLLGGIYYPVALLPLSTTSGSSIFCPSFSPWPASPSSSPSSAFRPLPGSSVAPATGVSWNCSRAGGL